MNILKKKYRSYGGYNCLAAIIAIIAFGKAEPAIADPVVTNATFTQRADASGMVDIYYDVAGGVEPMTVSIKVLSASGATWRIAPAVEYLSGDVGAGVTNGTGKHVVWDVKADQPGKCWAQAQIRVAAVDRVEEISITLPNDVPLVLVKIPAGTFQMGTPNTEVGRSDDEGPVHTVSIAYDFYMSKYEVTQSQWLAVMESWPSTVPDTNYGAGDTYPAYFVSWDDARNFIAALNNHIASTDQGPFTVRLPSSAEWEYACRAGTATRFYFGDSLGCNDFGQDCAAGVFAGNRSDYMWYSGTNFPTGTKPVGEKLPNAFGLYDMSGNIYEWCQDWHHTNYTGAPADGSAWELPVGTHRVVRGGHSYSDARDCRSGGVAGLYPEYRINFVGFRVALTVVH